jgi:hypothetical protein
VGDAPDRWAPPAGERVRQEGAAGPGEKVWPAGG